MEQIAFVKKESNPLFLVCNEMLFSHFCSKCGKKMGIRLIEAGYNGWSGEKVFRIDYKCPEYNIFLRRKHTNGKGGTYPINQLFKSITEEQLDFLLSHKFIVG